MLERFRGFEPRISPKAFVHPSACLIGEVQVGPGASIWPFAVLRGDCGPIDIGADSSIQDGCVVHATAGLSSTRVGARVTVGHRAVLHGCRIGDDCLIGMGCVILDNATIGAGSIVGAGAVVLAGAEFPENSVILGSPARLARETTAAQREWIASSSRAYLDLVEDHQAGQGQGG